jgi:hypothetical protein
LSRLSVPKEQLKIARHFNAGKGLEKSSPAGTAGRTPFESETRDAQTECANASSV